MSAFKKLITVAGLVTGVGLTLTAINKLSKRVYPSSIRKMLAFDIIHPEALALRQSERVLFSMAYYAGGSQMVDAEARLYAAEKSVRYRYKQHRVAPMSFLTPEQLKALTALEAEWRVKIGDAYEAIVHKYKDNEDDMEIVKQDEIYKVILPMFEERDTLYNNLIRKFDMENGEPVE